MTKVDILSFVPPNHRSLVTAIGLICILQYGTLNGPVSLHIAHFHPINGPVHLGIFLITFIWTYFVILSDSAIRNPHSLCTLARGTIYLVSSHWGIATMFNREKVVWLHTPLHDTNIALFGPFSGLLTGVYKLIIPSEDRVRTQAHNCQEATLKNAVVQLSTHSCIYCTYVLHIWSACTAPSHLECTLKLGWQHTKVKI